MQIQIERNMLWKGIPAVFHRGKYIIFSPYSKKLTKLTKNQLNNKKVIEKLQKEDFFGKPLKTFKKLDDNVDKSSRLSITLYLTENCNLKCIYCFDDCDGRTKNYFNNLKENYEMNPETAISILKTILKNYNKLMPHQKEPKLRIHFFGGEPTLKISVIKGVVDFLEKERIDATYEISTNLITTKEILNYLISKKMLFAISYDGIPEINNKQRPFKIKSAINPSEIVEGGIKQLVKAKAKIRPKVVVTNDSVEKMPEIVKHMASLGLNHIRLEPLLIDRRAEKYGLKTVNIKKFIEYFLKATDVAKELSKNHKRHIYVSNWAIRNLFQPRDHFCALVRDRIAIMPDGIMAKCARNLHAIESSPFIVGKINNSKLIINENKIKALQSVSVDKMPQCKNCFAKYICSGGCPNENLKENQTFSKPNSYKCELNKEVVKELIIKMYEEKSFKSPKHPDHSPNKLL